MGEEVIDSKDQEPILRKYLSFYVDKKSYGELKKEVLEKGYSAELFEKVYSEVYLNKFGKPYEKQTQKEDNLKKNNEYANISTQERFFQENQKPISGDYSSNNSLPLKTKTIQGEEFVMVPIKKEELEKALKKKVGSFFVPTQIMTYVFCIILILAVGYSLYKSFSFSSILNLEGEEIGKASLFKIGYPLSFISISISEDKPFNFNFLYFFVDFFLYLIISYVVDLSIRGTVLGIKKTLKEDEDYKDKKQENYQTNSNVAF